MSIQTFDAMRTNARAPIAAAARQGPFASLKWQALFTFFLQRFGVNQTVGGILYPLPVSLIAIPALIGWMIAKGWAKPSPVRIWLYCALVAGGCMSMLFAKYGGSALSMYMYFAIYSIFLFPVVLDDAAYERFFRIVVKIGAAICVIGVVQYMLQYVWQPTFLFSWRDTFAPEFLIEFNTLNQTAWGSGVYKANGFFLLEASWLSQLGARTMLLAIIMLRDPRWLLPCLAAMVASYSGTGIALFAIFGTIPLIRLMAKWKYLPWAIAGAVAVTFGMVIFSDALNLDLFINRLGEFGQENTSANVRFVVVGQAFQKFLSEPFITLIFGAGPGSVDYYLQGLRTDGFAPGWLKLGIDYGFFGLAVFSAFLVTCVYQTTRSGVIAAAILFQYLVLDGSLVVPQGAIMTYLSVCAVVRRSHFKPFGMQWIPTPSTLKRA